MIAKSLLIYNIDTWGANIYDVNMENIIVKIRKPLYGTFCYITGAIVEQAIRENKNLDIKIPQGQVITSPIDWKKKCRMMKKKFRTEPKLRIMYGNYVKVPIAVEKKKEKVKEESGQLNFL